MANRLSYSERFASKAGTKDWTKLPDDQKSNGVFAKKEWKVLLDASVELDVDASLIRTARLCFRAR
jgi:hypothetical protein